MNSPMWLVYKPGGGDEQSWWFTLGSIGDAEAEMIERRTGFDYGAEFQERLLKGNVRARRALLWLFLRRQHPALKYEDVHFAHEELSVEFDAQELGDMVAELEKRERTDVEQAALEAFQFQLASGEARPAGQGKALAPSDG